MTTDWAVSTAAERVALDSARRAEITFSVTNPGPVDDRAVLDIVTSDNADRSWFTVELPQRMVSAGATVPYVVKAEVPATAPAGGYWLQARVYSADTPPEESSRLSGRISFDVAGGAPAGKPWWILIAVLMLVLVVGVAGWLVFGKGDNPPPPPPAASPTAGVVTMTNLVSLSEADAVAQAQALGLTISGIRRRHDPGNADKVLAQSIPEESEIAPGDTVELEVAVELSAVQLASPSDNAKFPKGSGFPTLVWQAVPGAASYQVTVETELCGYAIVLIAPCVYESSGKFGGYYADYHARTIQPVTGTSFTPSIEMKVHPGVPRAGHSGTGRWQVVALDDFGNAGPAGGYWSFHVALRNPDEYGPLP